MTRHIAMLAFEDAQILDITGPLEVFARTTRWMIERGVTNRPEYEIELVSLVGGPLRTSSGLILMTKPAAGVTRSLDTFLVTGGIGHDQARRNPRFLGAVKHLASDARRIGSVCTGAMILAECGLLDGQPATTHWAYCDELRATGASVDVDENAIFVRNGDTYTSAGVTAGIDMALAMVEEDCGRPVALAIARELVLYLKRPGGQGQFSDALAVQCAGNSRFADLDLWVREHLDQDLTVSCLAEQVNMSPRNFSRAFKRQTGKTPGHFVESLRINRARELLVDSDTDLATIANQCGLTSADQLRRLFVRRLEISPSQFRKIHR